MAAAKKNETPPEDDLPAAGAEGEGAGVDLPKKKISGKKMAIILAAVLLLLIGGGAAAYFTGMFGSKPEEAAAAHEAEAKHEDEHASTAPVYYEMPSILVNLTSTGRRPVYLKIKVHFGLAKEEDRPKLTENQPRIIDSFQTYLRELTLEEIQDSANLLRLREELMVRVNAIVAPVVVKDLLFQDILPQ